MIIFPSLFIGLGNPGKEYQNTRHNVGRMFLDFLIGERGGEWQKRKDLKARLSQKDSLFLAQPEVFMNQSGEVVRLLSDKLKIKPESICLVHDELDIPLGKYKLSLGKSSYLHKGVLSAERYLKTKDFWRLRIGIDNRDPRNRIEGEKYVLQRFSVEEKQVLKSVFKKILLDKTITEMWASFSEDLEALFSPEYLKDIQRARESKKGIL